MTDSSQQPPVPPSQDLPAPPPTFQLSPQQPAKSRNLMWVAIGGGVIGLVLVACAAVGITLAVASDDEAPRAAASAKALSAWEKEQADGPPAPVYTPAAPAYTPEPEPEPTAGPTPAAADIKLAPKITKKSCFGSAGCNVIYKIILTYDGPALSEDDTFEVTYEVRGGEDGPTINSLEMSGTQYSSSEEILSVPSNRTKLTIKVTDVSKVS